MGIPTLVKPRAVPNPRPTADQGPPPDIFAGALHPSSVIDVSFNGKVPSSDAK